MSKSGGFMRAQPSAAAKSGLFQGVCMFLWLLLVYYGPAIEGDEEGICM